MISSFRIEYYTLWGEELYICIGQKPTVGADLPPQSLHMDNDGKGHWFAKTDLTARYDTPYHYVVAKGGTVIRTEWGCGHRLNLDYAVTSTPGTTLIFDTWLVNPDDQPFFSTAFTQSIFAHPAPTVPSPITMGERGSLTIECEAATLRKGQVLALCGNCAALGNWDPTQGVIMDANDLPYWRTTLRRDDLEFPMLYKFAVLDAETHELVCWDKDCNRYFDPGFLHTSDAVLLRNQHFVNPMNPWRGAGVALPVFSLRSLKSWGIGAFTDLKLLVDWAERTQQSIIQVLPINDTTCTKTWRDSYPYNSNSSFALNPIYIDPIAVGVLDDADAMAQFEKRRLQLNRLPAVDYERVLALKTDYLQRIYEQQGSTDLASEAYAQFYANNSAWLEPYAAFCCLRDQYHTANFQDWKESLFDDAIVARLNTPGTAEAEAMGFHKFVQFHLHLQLTEVRDYAHEHGIVLKGDIPIGISRCSVDAWAHSELFHTDCQAGAPPDAFDRNGQNWGFPTYNWPVMQADGYQWFKKRFQKMSDYFDAYRIDHILGFFRIWEVPSHAVQGLLGHFNPALPLSPEEMQQRYGFTFHYKRHTQPYLTDEVLHEVVDDAKQIATIKSKFFNPQKVEGEPYSFTPRFGTQRGVEGYFMNKPKETDLKLKIFQLLAEVLFVEDPRAMGRFHPRIDGIHTASFKALAPEQQEAYRALHEDFFYHRHNDFWRKEAMLKLPALTQATRMLVCGEDLGMIPACVPQVMQELHILSLEIQRMPKAFTEFGDPQSYPYYSVCTTSSHDLSNIRAWWEEDPERSQRYFTTLLQGIGDAPQKAEPWICRKIIEAHLRAPSMLTILPLQDWLSMDEGLRASDPLVERINTPSNPDNNWSYRMHLTLEELLEHKDFNQHLAGLIKKYGR